MRLAVPLVLALAAAGLARAQPAPPKLAFPLACTIGRTCEVQNYVDRDPGPAALDYRCGHRTYEGHKGVDIRILDLRAQARGVDVLAAAPGKVARLRDGVPDVSIRAAGAPSVANIECGNGVVIDHGGGWETQYCHMARGSIRVTQGQVVAGGQPIGRVGLSGQTEFPHLHFQVRHGAQIVDPFAPQPGQACAAAPPAPLWTPAAAQAMAYKRGAILNAGLAGDAVTANAVETGDLPAIAANAPAIVAWMRAIALEQGDVLEATLKGPSGVLASGKSAPLDRDKAQYFYMVGKKRPADGWPKGVYSAELKVWRAGKPVMARTATATL